MSQAVYFFFLLGIQLGFKRIFLGKLFIMLSAKPCLIEKFSFKYFVRKMGNVSKSLLNNHSLAQLWSYEINFKYFLVG